MGDAEEQARGDYKILQLILLDKIQLRHLGPMSPITCLAEKLIDRESTSNHPFRHQHLLSHTPWVHLSSWPQSAVHLARHSSQHGRHIDPALAPIDARIVIPSQARSTPRRDSSNRRIVLADGNPGRQLQQPLIRRREGPARCHLSEVALEQGLG